MSRLEKRVRKLEQSTGISLPPIPPRREGETVDQWALRLGKLGFEVPLSVYLYHQEPLPEDWKPTAMQTKSTMTLEQLLHMTWPENNPELEKEMKDESNPK